MPSGLFLVPMIQGTGSDDPHRGKYANVLDYPGDIDNAKIVYLDVDHAAVALITGKQSHLNFVGRQSDVIELADDLNIDQVLSVTEAASLASALELLDIPAQWVNATLTRRQVIRILIALGMFSMRLRKQAAGGFRKKMQEHGLNLNSTWVQFPQGLKDQFIAVAQHFGWDVQSLGLNAGSTLRQILKTMIDQFENQQIKFGGFVL